MILTLVTWTATTVSAQEYVSTPVEISKEKLRIGGQVCYSHIVLEKQTLYSICKAYNVTADDIYKYNPGVKENGLKKNSILNIPYIEKQETKQQEEAKQKEVKQQEEAKPTETKPAEEPAQPEVQTAEPVKIVPKVTKVHTGKRKIHTVKWFEDLESIAAKYGITAGEIMRANNLTSHRLMKRQKLIIPNPGEYPADVIIEIPEQPEAGVTTPSENADTLVQEERKSIFPTFFFPKKEIEMTLLLPLKATGTTSSRQNMDFYSGVLLAIYDMSKEGISTDLNVFDVADGNIPDADSFMGSDIIIGPVAAGDINRTFTSAPEIKALVSPLDPRAEHLTYTRGAMIHAPTPHAVQYNDLISWMKEDMMPGDTVLFITEKGAAQTDAVVNMTAAIDSSGLEYNRLSYSILEGRNVTETLTSLMTATAANRVYIASESEAFVNDVVRNLNVMIHQKYNVVLYAPSKIRSFETIEVENFHNTQMRVSTGYYIDYNDAKVKEFLLRYRALFNTEPTQFAYQGYDLAKYFIGLCSKYGDRWIEKLDKEDASMLQSTFDFTKTPTGGYINKAARRIVYGDNWSVNKIR